MASPKDDSTPAGCVRVFCLRKAKIETVKNNKYKQPRNSLIPKNQSGNKTAGDDICMWLSMFETVSY